MSLQAIIDESNEIGINRKRLVGMQIARNQMVKTNETPGLNPWQFSVNMDPHLPYHTSRAILEKIDNIDRITPEEVTFGNQPNMKWLMRYQGEFSSGLLNTISLSSFTGNQLVLNVSSIPTVGNTTKVLFAPGDFIQIKGYPFPFTSTSTVLRGSATTVTVTTHRPNVLQTVPTVGTLLNFGSDVIFRVLCINSPAYKISVGATTYQYINGINTLVNNGFLEFAEPFQLYEYII